MTKAKKPVWYIALPAYQYNENIQELADAAGLRIIDATVTDDRTDAAPNEDLPVVTLREEFTPEHLAALAAIVPADKMEAAILERVRAEFRAMPYERQLAAYHASTGQQDAPGVDEDQVRGDAPATSATPEPGTDQLAALNTEDIGALAASAETSLDAPQPRKKKGD